MENLQVNQMETQRPVINNKIKWIRTTFNCYNGKAWCYRRVEKHEEYDREIEKDYYCANPTCKNELIFKWTDDNDWRENEPFRFHKLLVKVLEKKDDDWRTGRKTHTYYAFCCKCAKKDTSDGTIKKKFGKVMGFEMEKCDCATFIEDERREATDSIKSYRHTIEETTELIKELEAMKEKLKPNYADVNNSFKGRRLNDFIKQLESRRGDAMESKHEEEDYLLLYNEWETKRNQQLEEI